MDVKLYLRKNAPTILTFVGSVGVVVTTVTAVKATPKAMKLIEKATDEKGEELTRLEIVKTAGKVYIPTVLIGTSTIACIFGANLLNKRSQALISSAYALLSESYDNYRATVRRLEGDETDSYILSEMVKDTEKVYVSSDGVRIYTPDDDTSDKILCYDDISKGYFESTMANVINAQYHVNRNLQLKGQVSLNEFYDFLGLEHVDDGDILGWGSEFFESGLMWLDFKNDLSRLDDGLECMIVSCLYSPELL